MKILTSKRQGEIAAKLAAIGIMALSDTMEDLETNTKFVEVLADVCTDVCGIEIAKVIGYRIFERLRERIKKNDNQKID